ncbi:tripartite tricarboxylate transporter substrate binding protein [Siccirubricoccus sp. G192]|uniref:Bug family tripartite tricarboxylate transporter substrate binding protein n=1 Tax=Siccirubricoccus sp. G192 TaxID=2849651 RepID=UPI001C2C7DE7|nr:tripartite tricarboxylate transporter substrate binding protein [Siccirubricoccus sp. G192]MBV1800314.1 tripartite tricarboxylate transporter substrate binding protein [Siccirubricoccus sp. G192]MBV1800537.1 tripartite tricarboxylate transporter substrate binding protein [Siccirubricoccus sp. G192]
MAEPVARRTAPVLARRSVLAGGLVLFAAPSWAQTWPSRPVRIIVPVAPGGSVDALARVLGRHLSEALGQPFVIESHAGGGGNIAFEMVAAAKPDGHTILAGWDSVAINPSLYRSVPYDPLRSFAPVIQTVRTAQILVVRNGLPVRTLPEFLDLARQRTITLGTPGNGSIGHLAAELIKSRTGVGWTHVLYRGGGSASMDLLAGHIDALSLTLAAVVQHVRGGRMRAIAVSTASRAPALPEVPTVAESGLPGYDVVSWQGLLAPAGTNPQIVARLNAEVNRTLALQEVARQLNDQGLEPVGGSPEVLAALLRADVARWPAIVQAAGARLD